MLSLRGRSRNATDILEAGNHHSRYAERIVPACVCRVPEVGRPVPGWQAGWEVKAGRRGELYIQLLPAAMGCKTFNRFPFLRLVLLQGSTRRASFVIFAIPRYAASFFLTRTLRLAERH